MKLLKNILEGILFLGLPLLFSSCEDILGTWDKPTPTPNPIASYDTTKTPLTLEAVSGTLTLTLTNQNTTAPITIEYSTDEGTTWTSKTVAAESGDTPGTETISGAKILLRGSNATYAPDKAGYHYFNITGDVDHYIYGNVMSLIDKDNFATLNTFTADYAFYALFYNNTHFKSNAQKALVLPATTLTKYCYMAMFFGCTGLTAAPELPATTMAENCYATMFFGCTGLTTAPTLPATTLAESCYTSMFQNCTGLTTAPALPATTLAARCYYDMFDGCTGLTAAPELPAPTLVERCYSYMFYGCSSLTSVTCFATDISATYCTSSWLVDVAATGTVYTKPTSSMLGEDWKSNSLKGIPAGWTRDQSL